MVVRVSVGFLLIIAAVAADEGAVSPSPFAWHYFCHGSAFDMASARNPGGLDMRILPDPNGSDELGGGVDGGGRQMQQEEEPDEAEVEEEEAPTQMDGDASGDGDDGTTPLTSDQVAANLAQLQGTCYFLRVNYWTYEVCPFASVRQYHSESGAARGAAVSLEHSLGKYKGSNRDSYSPASGVYSQYFEAGSEGRASVVRFVCPDSWRDEDGVVGVHEPAPKQYHVTVRVHAMCPKGSGKKGAKPSQQQQKAAARRRLKPRPSPPASPTRPTVVASGPMQIAEMSLPNTRILAPLRGRCFQMAIDYWTYELCPMQHVRQFRQERNRVGVEFNLGMYDKAKDGIVVGVRGKLDPSVAIHTLSQGYVNGTAKRQATVRLRCSMGKNEHALLAVEEPAMHQYVVVFSTPLACEVACVRAQKPRPAEQSDSADEYGGFIR